MNLERLEQAIAVMKRAGKVDMGRWQSGYVKNSEFGVHACGNSACFAGWLAVSQEFREAGGEVGYRGEPLLSFRRGHAAVIGWLEAEGLKAEVLELLITSIAYTSSAAVEWLKSKNIPVMVEKLDPLKDYWQTQLPNWHDYKADDVIKILEALRD